MNDLEVRVRCVEAAAMVPGNPNTLLQAREFYNFVTEARVDEVTEAVTTADVDGVLAKAAAKKSPKAR